MDGSRWPLLLYQTGVRLLTARSIREVIGTALELAAEHSGASSFGWFRRGNGGLEPVCVVPPGCGLADRIAVMYRGKIVGIVPPNTPRDVLGLMMAGISYDDAVATTKESSHE